MSNLDTPYVCAHSTEAIGSDWSYGIKIDIAAPNGVTEGVRIACYKAAELLEQAITRDFYSTDKASLERAALERRELLALFAQPIYVEAIPNGYCPRACCEHRPWFVVTTKIGRITIGWRKSVISINWRETLALPAQELFPKEDVTKGGPYIHAWGYEKAQEYLNCIVESASAIEKARGEE